MPEIILGTDIGSQTMKLALVRQDKRFTVLGTAVVKTPEGSVLDGEITYAEGIASRLREFIDGAGVKPTGLAACMNSPNIITRKLTLPAMNASEISAAVKFEMLKLFPSIKDTHVITQRTLESDAANVTVLAALCPGSLIRHYTDLAARLGIPFKYADVHANAQAKAIARFFGPGGAGGGSAGTGGSGGAGARVGAGSTGLLIDIGYRSSLVSVLSRGKLVLSRHGISGAAAFDNMIAEKAGVSRDEVESARHSGDFSKIVIDPADAAAVQSVCFLDIDDQVRQTIEFYEYEKPKEKLSFVSVVGEGGSIPEIGPHFADALNLEPRELLPTADIKAGRLVPKLLIAAIGAAIREPGGADQDINFLETGAYAGGRRGGPLGSRLLTAAALGVIILGAAIGTFVFFASDYQKSLAGVDQINGQIRQFTDVSEQSAEIAAAQKKLADLTAVMDAIDRNSVKASEMIETLTDGAPEGLFAINFNVLNANEIVLTGKSKEYADIAGFALLLRGSGKYGGVQINSITANQSASEEITDYSFSLTVKP